MPPLASSFETPSHSLLPHRLVKNPESLAEILQNSVSGRITAYSEVARFGVREGLATILSQRARFQTLSQGLAA